MMNRKYLYLILAGLAWVMISIIPTQASATPVQQDIFANDGYRSQALLFVQHQPPKANNLPGNKGADAQKNKQQKLQKAKMKKHFEQLPPKERARRAKMMERLEHMSPEQREAKIKEFQERREALKQELMDLPPEQREARMKEMREEFQKKREAESDARKENFQQRWKNASDEERRHLCKNAKTRCDAGGEKACDIVRRVCSP